MSYTPVELRHVKVGRSLFGYNRATVEQLIAEVAQSFEATWRERGELGDKVEALEKQIAELRSREHLLTQTLIAAEQAASDVRERARREAETIVQEAHNESRAIGRSAQAERERLFVESKRIEGMLRAALGMIEEETTPCTRSRSSSCGRPRWSPSPRPHPSLSRCLRRSLFVEPQPVVAASMVEQPAPVHVVESPPSTPEPVAPAVEPELVTGADDEYGWSREDTREFEPISGMPEPEPEPQPEAPIPPVAEPALRQSTNGGSRDFDWGE